jgi:hypothetical protein
LSGASKASSTIGKTCPHRQSGVSLHSVVPGSYFDDRWPELVTNTHLYHSSNLHHSQISFHQTLAAAERKDDKRSRYNSLETSRLVAPVVGKRLARYGHSGDGRAGDGSGDCHHQGHVDDSQTAGLCSGKGKYNLALLPDSRFFDNESVLEDINNGKSSIARRAYWVML